MAKDPQLTIAKLAVQAGVGVETVRFYQRKDLVREPARPLGGIRRYSMADVARIRFIRAAQDLGFTLTDVRELLRLDDGMACNDVRRLGRRKLETVRARLAQLRRMERTLASLLDRCESARGRIRCPLIDALQAEVRKQAVR